jgi:hypothetical protein
MQIWFHWWNLVRELKPACSRNRTFLWLAVSLAGICTRSDLAGVTSIVRALGLKPSCHNRLLDFFHSHGIDADRLAQLWTQLVLRFFTTAVWINNRLVLLCDGIKIPKAGRKMPGVKLIRQDSDSNTKPQYIMGHSCQAVSLVVNAFKSAFAVPLAVRIHEGVIFSNRSKQKLTDKMVSLTQMTGITLPYYLVGDAYYACQAVALGLIALGNHLVTRVRNNAVAFYPVPKNHKKKPGRPRFYGKKIKLNTLLKNTAKMTEIQSPVYGETNVVIRYLQIDLIWKPLRRLVRFVAVVHPGRGKCLLMTTDLTLGAVEIIRIYGIRFKIEVSFKAALHTLGVYAYRFWMQTMKPIKRRSLGQYMHHETEKYRRDVRRKLAAYHCHIQVGLIAQGLLQYLSTAFPALVWKNFGSWLRTIRPGIPPSEAVTAQALRTSLPGFLTSNEGTSAFTKFLLKRIDLSRYEGLRLAG